MATSNDSNYMVYTKHMDATYENPQSKMFSSGSSGLYYDASVKKSRYKEPDSFNAVNDFRTPMTEGDFNGSNRASTEKLLDNIAKNSNYYMSYTARDGLDIRRTLNVFARKVGLSPGYDDYGNSNGQDSQSLFEYSTMYYNRFKTAIPNDAFQKGFAHVFFVKPNCNVCTGETFKLHSQFKNDAVFQYAYQNSPYLLRELCQRDSYYSNLMFSLSNRAAAFSLQDEFIGHETYGTTYSGWKIAFGRNTVESKTAGQFEVTFRDDKNFHIYHLHKLWVEYISGVYSGKYVPQTQHITNKILDYASAVYYIITAEDGETILFWSKYYGVFPTTIPSTQYGWSHGSLIGAQSLDVSITYQYSFKEDFHPSSLIEINDASNIAVKGSTQIQYAPTYDAELGHTGEPWVKIPYVEAVNSGGRMVYKLRFLRSNGTYKPNYDPDAPLVTI